MPTVRRWGNSLGIRLPKALADQLRLREGSQIEFDTSDGVLTIRLKRRRYTLAGLLRTTKGRRAYRDLDRDKPVGTEIL